MKLSIANAEVIIKGNIDFEAQDTLLEANKANQDNRAKTIEMAKTIAPPLLNFIEKLFNPGRRTTNGPEHPGAAATKAKRPKGKR